MVKRVVYPVGWRVAWRAALVGGLLGAGLLGLGGGAAGAAVRFPDVADDHLRRLDILFAAERGWFQGYPDGTFRPDRTVPGHQLATVVRRAFPDGSTRGQLAKFVFQGGLRVAGLSLVDGSFVISIGLPSGFTDVPDGHRYEVEIFNVVKAGWFQGYPDGTFRPDQTVTPAQIAKVLQRVFSSGSTRADLAAFMREGAGYLPIGPAPPGGEPGSHSATEDLLLYTKTARKADGEYGHEVWAAYGRQIWAAGTDGTNPVRLVEDPVYIVKFGRSPDGAHIAYSVAVFDEEGMWSELELWAVGLDGAAPRRLVGGLPVGRCYSRVFWVWSPDGENIAYEKELRDEDGDPMGKELWVAGMDGAAPRRVNDHLFRDGQCPLSGNWEWSPTGESIAYEAAARDEDGEPTGRGLWAAGVEVPYHRLLTDNLTNPRSWGWGLAGGIAFAAGDLRPYELWTAGADGTGGRRLTDVLSSHYNWTWSLDGERIAYTTAARNRDGYWREIRLWVAEADGSGARMLDENSAGFGGFRWSPDGERIAYKRSVRVPFKEQLYVAGVDGSEPVMWADGLHFSGLWEWSPEGDSIAHKTGGELWVVAGAGEETQLAVNEWSTTDWWEWSPTGETIAYEVVVRDEKDDYVRTELWAADADGSDPRRLSGEGRNRQRIRWAPDGKNLAYWVREGWDRVWIASADGSGLRLLTHESDTVDPFAWSPDGRHIAHKSNGILVVEATDDPAERLIGWAGDYALQPASRPPEPVRNIYTSIVIW